MEEELTCTSCSSTWKRVRTRGRKPLLCPSCLSGQAQTIISTQTPIIKSSQKDSVFSDLSVSSVHSQMHPKPSNHQELKESTKNGSIWKCPGCGSTLKMFVSLSAVPTHRCTPDTVTLKIMERVE